VKPTPLTDKQVASAFRSQSAKLNVCAKSNQETLKSLDLGGRLLALRVTVRPDGGVSDARMVLLNPTDGNQKDLDSPKLNSCMTRQARQIKLHPNTNPRAQSYLFPLTTHEEHN
jgi:hypothetical protein